MMKRRGFTLMETLVAGVILAATLTVCLQMLVTFAARNRAIRIRQTAIQEAANAMERLAASSWDDLTPGRVKNMRLGEEARQVLPGGKLEIDITPASEGPEAKRITAIVSWTSPHDPSTRSVRLLAWKYRTRDN